MIAHRFKWLGHSPLIFSLCVGIAADAGAQFQQGGAGRTGTARSSARTSGTAREYLSNTMIGDATVTSDPETGTIFVMTDEETGQYISQVITNLDRPKPQVLIKVVFVEVTYNKGSDIGIEGTLSKKINATTTGSVSNLFGLTSGLPGGQGPFPMPPGAGLYQILGQDFQATLRAIAEAGKAEVLSRPSILARHNQPATITVGQRVPLIQSVSYNNLTGNPINSVGYEDVGIILRVTPFITADGMVEMIVSPELSSISTTATVSISEGVEAPVIDTRSADTVVVTPDRQTVIIGGLMGRTKSVKDSKIPLLGDIPLLGAAFRRKAKSDVKTELIIFLTPYIVMDPAQLAGLTDRERTQSELVPKAFEEGDLDRALDQPPASNEAGPRTQAPSRDDGKAVADRRSYASRRGKR